MSADCLLPDANRNQNSRRPTGTETPRRTQQVAVIRPVRLPPLY